MTFHHPDLFTTVAHQPVALRVGAVRPHVVLKENFQTQWPPNYLAIYAWRLKQLETLRSSSVFVVGAKAYYKLHPTEFIMDWLDTYDPRKPDIKWLPFVLFERQADMVQFIIDLITEQESGLIEKCRDFGATWIAAAVSVWAWLFIDEFAIGWGSRREDLVDKLGIVDSIFEKIRMLIRRLPVEFLPAGFNDKDHLTYMRCVNPENGSTIAGESGDNIGRGGRKSVYFKDESAHYERPQKIEAALGDNTNVQIDMSSVNGLGNPFHNRREQGVEWVPGATFEKGKVRVLVLDWRDHPEKTQEWYERRKAKWVAEGLGHLFAQEVDRDYSGAVANTIIQMEWIIAAIDAHKKIPGWSETGLWASGFDIADEGGDTNAQAMRRGNILRRVDEWGSRDPGVSARRAIKTLLEYDNGIDAERNPIALECYYDSIGMGSNVKSEWNRLTTSLDAETKPEIDVGARLMVPWNAGGKVQWPFHRVIPDDDESPYNRDFYMNIKAQAWYALRNRFIKTWQCVTQGIQHSPDDMISIDSTIPLLQKIKKELAQPTSDKGAGLKILVEKKPDGTKSPNLADAIVMCYFPVESAFAQAVAGDYGNG